MPKYTDDQIKAAVDAVFEKFDTDKNHSLDESETLGLINEVLAQMNAGREVTK